MSLPTSYLTSSKNLKDILEALQSAQAPKKFTLSFLESLGFKSTADRLIIAVLKALGFLNASGEPTQRYYEFLDRTQASSVLGQAIQEAYADLFQINTRAHDLSISDIQNKMKTLSQGQFSDSVLGKMARTFKALSALAEFSPTGRPSQQAAPDIVSSSPAAHVEHVAGESHTPIKLGGLVYNIQIHLPESRDPAVYDALFRSLKEHLFR